MDWFSDLLRGGREHYGDDVTEKRVVYLHLFSLVGITVVAAFGFYNLAGGNLSLMMVDLGCAALAGLNLLVYRSTGRYALAASGLLAIVLVLFFFLLFHGGVAGTGILWFACFPVVAFFLMGTRGGSRWVAAAIILLALLWLAERGGILVTPYEPAVLRQLTVTILVLSFLVFLYEIQVTEFREKIRKRNRELTALNATLEERVDREVAKRREKEELLQNQTRLAMQGELLNNIAHQWRQPLNTLGLLIQDIKVKSDFDELDKAALDNNVKESVTILKYMSGTIDDFRDFYMPGKQRRPYDLYDPVAKAVAIMAPVMESRKVQVVFDGERGTIVDGFENELAQVLLNILGNAKDVLLERNVPEKRIRITLVREGERPAVRIEDNGGGIAPEHLERIFEPYFTTKEGKGTGIGLYMSKTIVEGNMGGKLSAENTVEGARFTIRL